VTDHPSHAKRRVLRLVAALGGAALGPEINEAAPVTVGAHLTKLRDEGYLRSRPHPESGGRTYRWELTPDGRAVVELETETWQSAVAALETSGTTDDEECLYCRGNGTVTRKHGTVGASPASRTYTQECRRCGGSGVSHPDESDTGGDSE
jgi:DNA-binding transcriptional ArsR family regulator